MKRRHSTFMLFQPQERAKVQVEYSGDCPSVEVLKLRVPPCKMNPCCRLWWGAVNKHLVLLKYCNQIQVWGVFTWVCALSPRYIFEGTYRNFYSITFMLLSQSRTNSFFKSEIKNKTTLILIMIRPEQPCIHEHICIIWYNWFNLKYNIRYSETFTHVAYYSYGGLTFIPK